MGTVTQLAVTTQPDVAGYVEAVTADRVLGWAWCPRSPGLRAGVELRLGDDVVARALADLPRADLASSGIGDGSHAFSLAIPEPCQGRASELRVFAQAGDGVPVAIGPPPAAEALSDQVGRMMRGLDVLVGSQRVLHRNLQAALTARPDGMAEQLLRLASAQAAMAEQLADVERFVVRLDKHLAAAPQPGAKPPGVPRAALWALAVAGCALVTAVVGLVRSLGG